MDLSGKVTVVTGAGRGIGEAIAYEFGQVCRAVVVADRDTQSADAVTKRLADAGVTANAYVLDVTDEKQMVGLIDDTHARYGQVDVMVSNAGIATGAGVDAPVPVWQDAFGVNVMAHVHAANACLPGMRARGGGALVQIVSAAALTTMIGDAPYTVTKHAALGLAEWLAVMYGTDGIQVCAVCPQGVETRLLREQAGEVGEKVVRAAGDVLSPGAVARAVRQGVEANTFLILPHADVATFGQAKRADPERWIAGMQRFARKLDGADETGGSAGA